jgi:hypothetical protein
MWPSAHYRYSRYRRSYCAIAASNLAARRSAHFLAAAAAPDQNANGRPNSAAAHASAYGRVLHAYSRALHAYACAGHTYRYRGGDGDAGRGGLARG